MKGSPADGHLDVFAYNSNGDEQSRRLGNLFVVGHVYHETDDVTYSTSLLSALAKREYYARPSVAPKEAFTNTLHKINEVVEEFFQHKGLKVDIGIFAIAGEQMLLSRLGKFKILLVRNGKIVDVLNNVEFFNKEHLGEKQFSNILSGAIGHQDKILAFYPTRSLIARERYLKNDLLKLPPDQFVEKLNAIKQEKGTFCCAALYINMERVKERASSHQIQPQELRAQAQLAGTEKPLGGAKKTNFAHEKDISQPIASDERERAPVSTYPNVEPEVPRIIPAEFSQGKKNSPFTALVHRMRLNNFTSGSKTMLMLVAVTIIIGLSLLARSFFFTNPAEKELARIMNDAEVKLKLAHTKVDQQDITGARELLMSSLLAVAELNAQGETQKLKSDLLGLLDEIDRAIEVSPALVYQVPSELGSVSLIAWSPSGLFAYAENTEIGTGYLAMLASSSLQKKWEIKDMKPSALFGNDGTAVLIDAAQQKISALVKETVQSRQLALPAGVITFDMYDDNMYLVTGEGISKITDAAVGKNQIVSWLKDNAALVASPTLMTIDGNIYLLDTSGTLATYYKGEKKKEINIAILPGAGNLLLSAPDGNYLFFIDKKINRVYMFDKESGTFVKTMKIDSAEPIISATVDNDNTVYFLTRENKIWRIN